MLDSSIASYVRLLAFAELSQLFRGNLAQWRYPDLLTGALLLTLIVSPSSPRRGLAMVVVRALQTLVRLPYVWDAEILGLLSALAVLPPLLPSSDAAATAGRCGSEVRIALCVLYTSAGFWKLNHSFLDRRYSCGSIYAVQLLEAYAPLVGVEPTASLAHAVTSAYSPASPLMTAVGEIAIGVGFALPGRRARQAAVALGLTLHLGICLTPPPNNIGAFSVAAAGRFFWALPEEASIAIQAAARSPALLAAHGLAGVLLYLLANVATSGAQADDAPLLFYGAIASVLTHALFVDGPHDVAAANQHDPSTGKSKPPTKPRGNGPRPRRVMIGAALLWAVSVPLGLMDIAAPNMFSNLKQHAGSNHILGAPTGLLQSILSSSPHRASGGGVVRVESASDGSFLASVYPAEVTGRITPRARELLKSIGHSGRQWHSALARVVGPFALPPQPTKPASYTLPVLELRRVLAHAAQRDAHFVTHVSWLTGAEGDESWRRGAKDALSLRLEYSGGAFWCTQPTLWGAATKTCPEEAAAALLPHSPESEFGALALWDRALSWPQAWKSMPLIPGDDAEGVHCGS